MGIRTKSNPSTFYIRTGNIDFKSIYAFHRQCFCNHAILFRVLSYNITNHRYVVLF